MVLNCVIFEMLKIAKILKHIDQIVVTVIGFDQYNWDRWRSDWKVNLIYGERWIENVSDLS